MWQDKHLALHWSLDASGSMQKRNQGAVPKRWLTALLQAYPGQFLCLSGVSVKLQHEEQGWRSEMKSRVHIWLTKLPHKSQPLTSIHYLATFGTHVHRAAGKLAQWVFLLFIFVSIHLTCKYVCVLCAMPDTWRDQKRDWGYRQMWAPRGY